MDNFMEQKRLLDQKMEMIFDGKGPVQHELVAFTAYLLKGLFDAPYNLEPIPESDVQRIGGYVVEGRVALFGLIRQLSVTHYLDKIREQNGELPFHRMTVDFLGSSFLGAERAVLDTNNGEILPTYTVIWESRRGFIRCLSSEMNALFKRWKGKAR